MDVSVQVDLTLEGGLQVDWDRRATPHYSREDIKEQYCITSRQLDAVSKSSGGIFGCLTSRGPSPCSATKASILSACVKGAPSEESLQDAPYPRSRPIKIPSQTYPRHPTRYDYDDEEDWPPDSSYWKRRPNSYYAPSDPKRYAGF